MTTLHDFGGGLGSAFGHFLLLSQFHGHGSWLVCEVALKAGLHYGGEGLRSVKNAWPRHGYMRQMVNVPEKN